MRFFCIILFAVSFAFSKDVEGHSNDMWSIFPFDKSAHAENFNIQEFYKEINSFVDYCEYPAPIKNNKTERRECSRLQELFKDSRYEEIDKKCRWGNHRIWFHWGFFNSSKKSEMVKKKINSSSSCQLAIKAASIDVNKEMDLLFEKRKRHLMKQWDAKFNTPKCQSMSTKKKEAFVSLLYSIHILGDYTNNQLNELQRPCDLYESIRNDILTIGDHSATAKKFLEKIGLKSLRTPSATELLDNLSKEFTPFLYDLATEGKDYISAFGEKYKLKSVE